MPRVIPLIALTLLMACAPNYEAHVYDASARPTEVRRKPATPIVIENPPPPAPSPARPATAKTEAPKTDITVVGGVVGPGANPTIPEHWELYPGQVAPDDSPLYLGTYPLAADHPVVDGDTIKVVGLDATLRLIGLDTEEKFKNDEERIAARINFAAYAKEKRGDGGPRKYGTEVGHMATEFAKHFFEGHDTVRLEYDDPIRRRGYYGRHLTLVWIKKDGEWSLYNVEAVRAGMAPYFPKYGRSARFHKEFVEAQKEAQAKKLGVWNPKLHHYPDYDERLSWWDRRADAIDWFRSHYKGNPKYIELGVPGAWEALTANLGKKVILYGTIGGVRGEGRPYRISMSHRYRQDFQLIAFGDEELAKVDPEKWRGEYVYVEGVISEYKGRPQIKVGDLERIWLEPTEAQLKKAKKDAKKKDEKTNGKKGKKGKDK